MLKILALQKLASSGFSAADADSTQSVTCGGCSCASNVCQSEVVKTTS
jgi:hypothetical protein